MNLIETHNEISVILDQMLYNGIVKDNLELAYELFTWIEAIQLAVEKQANMQIQIRNLITEKSQLAIENKNSKPS